MNTYKLALVLSVAFAIFFILFGCGSEEDTVYPEVSVSMPLPGNVYEFGDTIFFSAVMSDNVTLTNVEVILMDQYNKPMLPGLSTKPGQNPFTFTGEYIINDPLLASGVYQLRFQASDGINVANQFVEIRYHELPREMLYPIIVTHPGTEKWQVYKLDSSGIWQEFYLHTGDYCGSAVNSEASQFYISGRTQSNLIALNLRDAALIWQVKPLIHYTLRWFEALNFSSAWLYVSCADGAIRAYDKTGIEVYKSGIYKNAFPGLTVVTRDLITADYTDSNTNDKYLVSFHNEGGLLIYSKFTDVGFIGFFNTDANNVLAFGNKNGQGIIQSYNGSENILTELHLFNEGVFIEAAAMDSDNYLITTSSGIFWYRLSKNSLLPFSPCIGCRQIAVDDISQLIYTSSGNELKVFSFPTASLLGSFPLPDTLIDLHIVFNK